MSLLDVRAFLLRLRRLGQSRIGQEKHPRHRHRILQRDSHDLCWIDDSRLDKVYVLARGSVEPSGARTLTHPCDHDTGIGTRVLCDLTRGGFERFAEDVHACP